MKLKMRKIQQTTTKKLFKNAVIDFLKYIEI